MDWEQAWSAAQIKANTDLQTQINTVNGRFGTFTGQVSDIAAVVADGSGALIAGRLTAVKVTADDAQTKGNGATASGAVYLVAKAAPAGYSAQYGWQITAGTKVVGMDAYVDNAGNASIAFTASKFSLTDPGFNGGLPGNVLSYAAGVFTFGVPVSIRTGDIAASAVSQIVTGTSAGTSCTASITTNGGKVVVIANYDGQSTLTAATGTNINQPIPSFGTMTLKRDITTLKTATNNTDFFYQYSNIVAPGAGGACAFNSTLYSRQIQTLITYVDTPAAGTYTYGVDDDKAGGLTLVLMELKR